MNKIYIENDEIKNKTIDHNIEIEVVAKNDDFSVNSIKIKVHEDSTLSIHYQAFEEIKLDIFIRVDAHVSFQLNEIRTGKKTKVQYKYYLEEYSNTRVNKFYNSDKMRALDIINLNGIGAKIDYHLKTISSGKEKYDIMIYHNYRNTTSNIINHGVNLEDGSLIFQVTSVVGKGKTNCFVNQQNRIISLNEEECRIRPNLLIEEYEVEANHAALIGKFSDEELFYLQSRGIPYDQAKMILTQGFLRSGMEEEEILTAITEAMNQYWR